MHRRLLHTYWGVGAPLAVRIGCDALLTRPILTALVRGRDLSIQACREQSTECNASLNGEEYTTYVHIHCTYVHIHCVHELNTKIGYPVYQGRDAFALHKL